MKFIPPSTEPVIQVEASRGIIVTIALIVALALGFTAFLMWLDHSTYRECLRVHQVSDCAAIKP